MATKRHGIKTDGGDVILNWELIGRVLREARDLDLAMDAATTISKAVKVAGIAPQPTVSKFGGNILIGFIARQQLFELGR